MGVHVAMSLKTFLLLRFFPFRHLLFWKTNFPKAAISSAMHVVAILIIIALSSPAAFAGAGSVEWDFTDGFLQGWRVKRGESVNLSSAGLTLVEEVTGPKLVSPRIAGGLGLVASGKFLVIRVASERDGYAILRIKGRSSLKMDSFWLRGGGGMESYTLSLGPLFPEDGRVEALSLDLLTGGSVTLQKIMIFDPNGFERLVMSVSDFWRTDTTTTKMINYIDGPAVSGLSFLVAGYILTAILFTAALIIFVIRKKPFLKSVGAGGCSSAPFRAFIAAFVVAAALLAVRTEYRWATLYGQDRGILSGDESGTRIFTLFSQELPDFLRFLDYVKSTVPEGESVRAATSSAGNYMRLARYRLLPVRSSEGATYIWSYNDQRLFYDEAKMTLMDGVKVIAAPVIRVGVFGGSGKGALYMVTGSPRSASLAGGVSPVAGAGEVDASRLSETAEEGA